MKSVFILAFATAACLLAQILPVHRHMAPPVSPGLTNWLDPAWGYRRLITISSPNTVTNYAVQLSLVSSNFDFSKSLSDGSDIRVTDSTGTNIIPYTILSYDPTGQVATVWIKPVLINSSYPTNVYLYYSNSAPATFTVPPTGIFTRPGAAAANGNPEDLLYDADTAKYYVTSIIGNTSVVAYGSTSLSGPWSLEGTMMTTNATGWDSVYIHGLRSFKYGTNWYLYYSACALTNETGYQVGYATATNFLGPYTKNVGNPVLAIVTNTWEAYRVFEPYVSQVGSTWYLFYTGESHGLAPLVEQIGYATASSPNGPWTKYAGNPVIPLSGSITVDPATTADGGLVGPVGGWYYLQYSAGVTATAPWTEALAMTSDFTNFYRWGSLYANGVAGEWDATDAHKGTINLFTNKWYLVYNGISNGPTYGWAIASATAVSTSAGFDPNQVFDYYDDFSGSTLDTNKWGPPNTINRFGGSATVSGGELHLDSGVEGERQLSGRRLFGVNKMVEVKCRHENFGVTDVRAGEVGLGDSPVSSQAIKIMDFNNANWIKGSQLATTTMGQAGSTNVVTHQLYFQSSGLALYRNNFTNAWESFSTNLPSTAIMPFLLSYTKVLSGATNRLSVDYFSVREYRTNEPSVTYGSAVSLH